MSATKETNKKAAKTAIETPKKASKPKVKAVEPVIESAVEAAPVEAVAEPVAEPIAETPAVETPKAFAQPDEVVVGRFYEVEHESGYVVGELIQIGKNVNYIQPWVNGTPQEGDISGTFAGHNVREISRELCYELSIVRA